MNVSTYFKRNFLPIVNVKLSIIKIYNCRTNSYVFCVTLLIITEVRVELVGFIIFYYFYKIDKLAANVIFVK